MRRVFLASLFAAACVAIGFVGTAGADIAPTVSLNPTDPVLSGVPIYGNVLLAFDFTDNSTPPSASAGINDEFNIVVDVFPQNTGGYIRMVAVAPVNSGVSNMVCTTSPYGTFQPVQQGQAECSFNFTTPGVWAIHAQYESVLKSTVTSESITNLRVGQ
ncbi:MAG: hypothetical protein WA614_07435 [Acidimicrobiales bacterium]|jgi:hypothetical protein